MKNISRILTLLVIFMVQMGCTPDIADDTKFKLYYYNALLSQGEDFISKPSFIGQTPHSFEIYAITLDGQVFYNPKLDGELTEKSHFYINPETGAFFVNQTAKMKTGIYSMSVKCISDGIQYSYPDMFIVKLNKPVSE